MDLNCGWKEDERIGDMWFYKCTWRKILQKVKRNAHSDVSRGVASVHSSLKLDRKYAPRGNVDSKVQAEI